MGSFLDIIESFGKRQKSPSFKIHKRKKKLEKNQAENHSKKNKEVVLENG